MRECVRVLISLLPRFLRALLDGGGYLYVGENGRLQRVAPGAPAPPQAAGSVRCVCISDTHLGHRRLRLPPGDVLLHAGDILLRNHGVDPDALLQLDDFNQWLREQPYEQCVCIAGNHDGALEELGSAEVKRRLSSAAYLEDESIVSVRGLRVHGSPFSEGASKNAAFQPGGGRYDAHSAMSKIPDGLDVLLTHGPGGLGQFGRGSPRLEECVRRVSPQYHVFGHMHATYGARVKGGVTLINASSADVLYGITHKPIVFDVTPRSGAPG